MRSYSHAGRDLIAFQAWSQIHNGKSNSNPKVFESGAHDGHYNSNSKFFREMGAPCLLVEADQIHAESLRLVETSEPRTIFLFSPIPYKYDGLETIFETGKHSTPDIMFLDINGG